MLAAMPIIIGTQFLLAFLNYDIQSVPSMALHPRLERSGPQRALRNFHSSETDDGRQDCPVSQHVSGYGCGVAASARTGPVG